MFTIARVYKRAGEKHLLPQYKNEEELKRGERERERKEATAAGYGVVRSSVYVNASVK